jgi:hypothetical protein
VTDIGDLYPITVETRIAPTAQQIADNEPGDLVDVTSVTVTVTTPDGTSLTPVVMTRTSLGTYAYDFPTTVAGLHSWWAVAVGTVVGTNSDTFVVVDTGPRSIGSVDEVVAHMRAEGMSGEDREKLRDYCVAATSAIEADLHRALVRRVVVDTFDGGCGAVFLTATPVLSITSVVDSGTTIGVNDYTVNRTMGILYRGGQQAVEWFDGGRQSVVVTYLAGVEQPPEFVRKIWKNTVARMWMSQQLPHQSLDVDEAGAVQAAAQALTGPEFRAYEAYRRVMA